MNDNDIADRAFEAAVAVTGLVKDAVIDFGYRNEGVPEVDAGWWAQLRDHGSVMIVEDAPSLVSAFDALAHKVFDPCPYCHATNCQWQRDHDTWLPGCG